MTKEELLKRLTAVCPEELFVKVTDAQPTRSLVNINYIRDTETSAVRITSFEYEDGATVRMWRQPSTVCLKTVFPTLEAAVQYLEMALPLGLWGANIPDIFKEPE